MGWHGKVWCFIPGYILMCLRLYSMMVVRYTSFPNNWISPSDWANIQSILSSGKNTVINMLHLIEPKSLNTY